MVDHDGHRQPGEHLSGLRIFVKVGIELQMPAQVSNPVSQPPGVFQP